MGYKEGGRGIKEPQGFDDLIGFLAGNFGKRRDGDGNGGTEGQLRTRV